MQTSARHGSKEAEIRCACLVDRVPDASVHADDLVLDHGGQGQVLKQPICPESGQEVQDRGSCCRQGNAPRTKRTAP